VQKLKALCTLLIPAHKKQIICLLRENASHYKQKVIIVSMFATNFIKTTVFIRENPYHYRQINWQQKVNTSIYCYCKSCILTTVSQHTLKLFLSLSGGHFNCTDSVLIHLFWTLIFWKSLYKKHIWWKANLHENAKRHIQSGNSYTKTKLWSLSKMNYTHYLYKKQTIFLCSKTHWNCRITT